MQKVYRSKYLCKILVVSFQVSTIYKVKYIRKYFIIYKSEKILFKNTCNNVVKQDNLNDYNN